MSSVRRVINEQLKDPEIWKEYDALKPEFDVAKALMEARRIRNLTQQELAEKVGMEQADISNLEGGRRNPSCALLYRLAEGMDMNLELKFIPKESVPDQRP